VVAACGTSFLLDARVDGWTVDAEPTEATALGNGLYQLRSGGEVPDFETGRRLVMDRFSPTTYEPQNESTWASLRERIQELDG